MIRRVSYLQVMAAVIAASLAIAAVSFASPSPVQAFHQPPQNGCKSGEKDEGVPQKCNCSNP
jgi:hypothetical protein